MRILYWPIMSPAAYGNAAFASDYQTDMLFHGLRTSFGDEVVDGNRMWWMYKEDAEAKPDEQKKIWGKGFTIYGLLGNDRKVDRLDLENKLYRGFFDFVIAPIHHTSVGNEEFIFNRLSYIARSMTKGKVAIIDGHDTTPINDRFLQFGIYFKRELVEPYCELAGIHPISFAFPEEKIPTGLDMVGQIHDFAPMVPANYSWNCDHVKSYIYNDEASYYRMYRLSKFAYTCKKAGWDTLRHLEILANACVPWFTDIEDCPTFTLHNFPKDLCIEAKKIRGVIPHTTVPYYPQVETYLGSTEKIKVGDIGHIDHKIFDLYTYSKVRNALHNWLCTKLTTRNLAHYVLEIMKHG